MSTRLSCLAILLGVVTATHVEAGLSLAPQTSPDLAIVETARQATVTIRVPGSDGEEEAIGAGFIHEGTRKIVTNAHVVGDRETLRIGLADGRIIEARVAGRDAVTDIALIDAAVDGIAGLAFSEMPVEVGETVHAVGTPFGLGQTVTRGIVSALDRAIDATTPFGMIQHDAPLNPGSSGGPVIDATGKVIGVNVAMPDGFRRDVGIAYAIPAAVAERAVLRLAAGIPVVERRLGVSVRALTPRLAGAIGVSPDKGALVESVAPGSAAEKAGVVPSDIIVSVGGHPVGALRDVAVGIDRAAPAAPLPLAIQRGDETLTIVLPPVPLAEVKPATKPRLRGGAGKKQVPSSSLGFKIAEDGAAKVLTIEKGSPAAAAGVAAGDVVVAVGLTHVTSAGEAKRLIGDAVTQPFALLLADKRGATRYVVVDPWAGGLDGDGLGGNMRNPRSAAF
jgi:S1-C subfamily serine protease